MPNRLPVLATGPSPTLISSMTSPEGKVFYKINQYQCSSPVGRRARIYDMHDDGITYAYDDTG